jgi:hypothetical protein
MPLALKFDRRPKKSSFFVPECLAPNERHRGTNKGNEEIWPLDKPRAEGRSLRLQRPTARDYALRLIATPGRSVRRLASIHCSMTQAPNVERVGRKG